MTKFITTIFAVIISVLSYSLTASAYSGINTWEGGDCMMNMMGGSWGLGFGLGWIFMILFWGLIILAIIALVRWLAKEGQAKREEKTPLEILKERYAKGEVDKKEYEEKKKDLT